MQRSVLLSLLLACTLLAWRASSGYPAQSTEERKWLAQGADLFRKGEFEAAVDCYQMALDANSDSLAAYHGMGLSHIQLRNYDKAFEAFEEALFINPNFAEAHYGLGIVYPLAKRDKKKAIEHYRMYLRLRPNAPDAAKVRDWIEQLTTSGTVKHDEVMVDLYNQGVEAYEKGEFQQAMELYQQALARNPHYAPNHHALGLAYVRVGRFHDAAAEFLETLKINPRHVETHYDLGVLYPVFQQFDKAIFHYTQYLKMRPDAPDAAQVRQWIEKIKVQQGEMAAALEIEHYNQGVQFYDDGKFTEAAAAYEISLQIKPDQEDVLRGLAMACIQLKQFDRAHQAAQKARRIAPDSPENYYVLGVLHTLLLDPVSAIVSYQKYLKLSPDAPDGEKVQEWIEKLSNRLDIGFFNRGVVYYEKKQYPKALEAFEQALQANPKMADAQRMIGFVHIQTKNTGEAIAALQKAQEMEPDSPENQYALGVAYTLSSDTKEAAEAYAAYKELAPQAEDIETVNQWIAKLETKNAIDLYNKGVEYYDQGQYSQAEDAYLESLAVDPSAYQTHLALALVYIQQKEFAQALESLRHAEEFGAQAPEVHYLYGVAYTLAAQKEKAVQHYRRYTELLPQAEDAPKVLAWIKKIEKKVGTSLYNRGLEFYEAKQYDQALDTFAKALELEPDADATHRALGLVHLSKKNFAAAEKSLSQAVRLKADSPETHYCLGVLYTLTGQPEKSVEHYENYTQLAGESSDESGAQAFLLKLKGYLAELLYNQAVEYYEKKKYSEAQQNAQQAVGSNPKFADAYRILGLAQLQMKNLTQAKENLQTALELEPQSPENHYALGVLYGVLRQPQKAANAYERYLELKPDAQDRQQVQEWVRGLRSTQE